jgi:hypothetical protein
MVVTEGEDTVKKWLFPFVSIYIQQGKEFKDWPRQRLPDRILFINAVKEAMQSSGVPQVDLANYILSLLQDASILGPSPGNSLTAFQNPLPPSHMLFHNLINVGVQKKQLKSKRRNSHKSSLQLPMQRAQPNLPGVEVHVNQLRPTETSTGSPLDEAHLNFQDCRSVVEPKTNHSTVDGNRSGSLSASKALYLGKSAGDVEPSQKQALQRAQPDLSGMEVDVDQPDRSGMEVDIDEMSSGLRVTEPSQKLALQSAMEVDIDDSSSSAEGSSGLHSINHALSAIRVGVHSPLAEMNSGLSSTQDVLLRFRKDIEDLSEDYNSLDCKPTKTAVEKLEIYPTKNVEANHVSMPLDADFTLSSESSESGDEICIIRRRSLNIEKLAAHPDLQRILDCLQSYYYCSGRESVTQLKLLFTCLKRIIHHSKRFMDIDSFQSLDYVLDSALKTPAIILDYFQLYSSKTEKAATIRNEVTRIRDLLTWRRTLLLLGSSDDLFRRQIDAMEAYFKVVQSKLQRMVQVRTREDLIELGMWSNLSDLRACVVHELNAFQRTHSKGVELDEIKRALHFQQLVIASMYTGMRPQRRGVWSTLKISDLQSGPQITLKTFKTSTKYKFLSMNIPQPLWQLLNEWIKTYRSVLGTQAPWVFITRSGGKRSISADIAKFFYAKMHVLISPTRIRQIYRTELEPVLSEQEKSIMDSSDGHLPVTVQKHYIKLDRQNDSIEADQVYTRAFGAFPNVLENPTQFPEDQLQTIPFDR